MPQNPPFYGIGMAHPMRIDPSTGGIAMTEGRSDSASIAISYVGDRYSIREPLPEPGNHIAESILHILFTEPGEHDTLPEFGSRMNYVVNDPNDERSTQEEFETWVEVSTQRWEKRAWIPVPEGVKWATTADGIDRGEAPVVLSPEFLKSQIPENLVAPFVTARQARAAEYPLGDADAAGHDSCSRYHGQSVAERSGVRFIRPRKTPPIPPAPDDLWHEVGHNETWLLISWQLYHDIRYWWLVADCYIQDQLAQGASRSVMDPTIMPAVGTLLRAPSKTRVLMDLAA